MDLRGKVLGLLLAASFAAGCNGLGAQGPTSPTGGADGGCGAGCGIQCQLGPTEQSNCAPPTFCASLGEAQGQCVSPCQSDADCASAGGHCETLNQAPGHGFCKPLCHASQDCGAGFSCDAATGECVAGSAPPGAVGSGCAQDPDCNQGPSELCASEAQTGFPQGCCYVDCSTTNGQNCPQGSICISGSGTNAYCLESCHQNFDCRQNYFCKGTDQPGIAVCIPRCNATANGQPLNYCDGTTQQCDPKSGDCVPFGADGGVSVTESSLGQLSVGSAAGSPLTLAIPADAVSFTFILQSSFGGLSTPVTVQDPNGQTVFSSQDWQTSPLRFLAGNDGSFGLLYPNSPRLRLVPGNYTVTLANQGGGGSAQASLVVKHASDPALTGGTLALNFWFVGTANVNGSGQGLTAATAPQDPSFQQALAHYAQIYAQAGITVDLAASQYLDADAQTAQAYSVLNSLSGTTSDLRMLMQSSARLAGTQNHSMNFFFVQAISGAQPGYVILGIASGIPGIPFVQGSNMSGVAIGLQDWPDRATHPEVVNRLGETMAHEGAHWLGLYHTTESDGQLFDPIPDTPECHPDHDTDGDGTLQSSECQGEDASDLMFWESGGTELSAQQSFVLLGNPAVQQ